MKNKELTVIVKTPITEEKAEEMIKQLNKKLEILLSN